MAKQLIEPGIAPANSNTATTRRQLLAGIAVASATVAISAPTIAKSLPANRAAWDRAMASHDRAKAAADAFDGPFWRIEDAYKAEVDKLPHVTITSGSRPMSTSDEYEVRHARADAQSLRYVEICAYADVKARYELAAAADVRDAKIAAIDRRLGRTAANDRSDALSDAICVAEEVLLKMPAPDGEALLWKVNRLYPECGGMWAEGYEAQTHADLRRLLARGQA